MDPLVHVAEQAPGIFLGTKMIVYAMGFVIFTMSFLAMRRAIATPNSGQGPMIAAGLLGGSLMLVAPQLPNVVLASIWGSGVTSQPLLSRISNGDPISTNTAAALQILALLGYIYAFKGLMMYARGAPRGTCSYAAAFWTFVAGATATAPVNFFNTAGATLGFGPLISAVS